MKFVTGDITTLKEGIILQQVNCRQKMASGVAKAIMEKWPVVYTEFMKVKGDDWKIGADLLGRAQEVYVAPKVMVFNLFSQQYFGREGGHRYTSYDALDEALQKVKAFLDLHELSAADVHHPAIGSGLGGAHWPTVASIIEHRLGSDTTLWVLPPS